MIKRVVLFFSIFTTSFMLHAGVDGKFDGYSRHVLSHTPPSSRAAGQTIKAFVQTAGDFDAAAAGLVVVRRFGDGLILAEGTADAYRLAAADSAVAGIRLSRPMYPANDRSAATVGADAVRTGQGLDGGQGYTGRGVLTGLFDTGFDFGNPAWDDAEGNSRLRHFFYFHSDGGMVEHEGSEAIKQLVTDTRDDCHGSHVLGSICGRASQHGRIAALAGDGVTVTVAEGALPYHGMAPDADIAISAGEFTDANIADGVAAIVDAANGGPCVVNLSLSDELGPHDGSDAFAAALGSLTDRAVIVVSSGNDIGKGRSLSADFGSGTESLGTFLRTVGWKSKASGTATVWGSGQGDIDLYLIITNTNTRQELARYKMPSDPDGEPFVITSADYAGGDGIPEPAPDDAFTQAYTDSWLCVYPERAPSGRLGWYIPFYIHIRPENEHAYIAVGLEARGRQGQAADMYISGLYVDFRSLWVPGYREGADDMSVSSLGAAKGVVCVGASGGLNAWGGVDGSTGTFSDPGNYVVGDVAPFSSFGTLRTGASLPHVVAPGAATVSVLSTPFADEHPDEFVVVADSESDGRRNLWTAMYGTSMSAPVVAGGIAQWLEADPSLTSDDVHDIIASTSAIPAGTAYEPVRWGAGLFNAYDGVREVLSRRAALAGPSAIGNYRLSVCQTGPDLALCMPGADNISGNITDMSGRVITAFSAHGDSATLRAPGPGVYIVTANGSTARIFIRN